MNPRFNILGLGAQATMTNLTAELETDTKRFLTSVNVNACREFCLSQDHDS